MLALLLLVPMADPSPEPPKKETREQLLARLGKAPGDAQRMKDAEATAHLCSEVLGRMPAKDEAARILRHLSKAPDRREALGDVAWALVNSKEFAAKHGLKAEEALRLAHSLAKEWEKKK